MGLIITWALVSPAGDRPLGLLVHAHQGRGAGLNVCQGAYRGLSGLASQVGFFGVKGFCARVAVAEVFSARVALGLIPWGPRLL